MQSEERRSLLLKKIASAADPISASALAAHFGVSRQIIVGDVALLRSAGHEITATPRGYTMKAESSGGILRQVAVKHTSAQMEDELNAIVDQGCTVLDVIVEHPVYGQLTGQLRISNRYEIKQFMSHCGRLEAHPLSKLTDGIHIHTLQCADEAAYERVKDELRKLNFLLE